MSAPGRHAVEAGIMEDVALVDVAPPKLVQVLVDDIWREGSLEAWRRTEGNWRGYVRWYAGVGQNRVGWVDQVQVLAVALAVPDRP